MPAGSTASPERRPYSAVSPTPSDRLPAAITVTVPAERSGNPYQDVVSRPCVLSADAPSRATRLPQTRSPATPWGRLPA